MVGSGSRWYGISGGGTSSVTAPPRTSLFARSRLPSSSTSRPSEISRCTYDRDSPVRSATNRSTRRTTSPSGTWSRRGPGVMDGGGVSMTDGSSRSSSSSSAASGSGASMPGASGSVAAASTASPTPTAGVSGISPEIRELREHRHREQEEDRRRDARVREVVREEPPRPDPHVHEVDDVAVIEAVEEVADGTAEQQPEGDGDEDPATRPPVVVDDQPRHREGHHREDRRRLRQQAEQDPRVPAVHEVQPVAEDRHRVTGLEVGDDPGLRELVEDDDHDRDSGEQHPSANGRPAPRRGMGFGRRRRRDVQVVVDDLVVHVGVPHPPRGLGQGVVQPVHAYVPPARWRAIVASPASSRTLAARASPGAAPRRRSSASVSAATPARYGSRAPSPGASIQSTILSSSSSPASLRRSWTARCSSRASPSARSSGVSAVSMTTTIPSWSATAAPARGAAWISPSPGASASPSRSPEPWGGISNRPSGAAAITAGIRGPSRFPTLGSRTFTR